MSPKHKIGKTPVPFPTGMGCTELECPVCGMEFTAEAESFSSGLLCPNCAEYLEPYDPRTLTDCGCGDGDVRLFFLNDVSSYRVSCVTCTRQTFLYDDKESARERWNRTVSK